MVTLTATNMTYRIMSMSGLVIFILDVTIIITHVYSWLCSNIIELVVSNTDVYICIALCVLWIILLAHDNVNYMQCTCVMYYVSRCIYVYMYVMITSPLDNRWCYTGAGHFVFTIAWNWFPWWNVANGILYSSV